MATKNIVPRATGEGSIGTTLKHWLNGFFDTVTATTFIGDLKGNADTATKATGDKNGNEITETYAPITSPTFTGIVTAQNVISDLYGRYVSGTTIYGGITVSKEKLTDDNEGGQIYFQPGKDGTYESGIIDQNQNLIRIFNNNASNRGFVSIDTTTGTIKCGSSGTQLVESIVAKSYAENGYKKLGDGFVLEWGTIQISAKQTLTSKDLPLALTTLLGVASSHSYGDCTYNLTATATTATAWSNNATDKVKFIVIGIA